MGASLSLPKDCTSRMKSQWIPFLAITAAVINAAVIGLLNDPRVDILNGIASALCLAIAFMTLRQRKK